MSYNPDGFGYAFGRMNTMDSSNASAWNRAVRRLALKVNLIALLGRVGMPLFCVGVLTGFLAYLLRRLELWSWYGVLGGGLLGAIVVIWYGVSMRRRFFRAGDSRAFLDEQLDLHGALCASAEGRGKLPDYRDCPVPYRWVSFEPFYWLIGGAAMAALGFLLPVYGEHGAAANIISVPPALTTVEDWIEQLDEQDEVDDKSVDELREQLEDLMNKPKEEMYTHAGLEAADALKEHAEDSILEFGRNLNALSSSLSEYQSEISKGKEMDAEGLMNARQQLQNGMLKPGGELARQLAQLSKEGLKQMSREQMEQLMEQMKQACECTNGMCKNGVDIADPSMYEAPTLVKASFGGVERGEGDAPLFFNPEAASMEGNPVERVGSEDMSHAAIGEQVGMQNGEHEKDAEQKHSLKATNQAAQPSKGGDAVWSDHISPREREALQKIFN